MDGSCTWLRTTHPCSRLQMAQTCCYPQQSIFNNDYPFKILSAKTKLRKQQVNKYLPTSTCPPSLYTWDNQSCLSTSIIQPPVLSSSWQFCFTFLSSSNLAVWLRLSSSSVRWHLANVPSFPIPPPLDYRPPLVMKPFPSSFLSPLCLRPAVTTRLHFR